MDHVSRFSPENIICKELVYSNKLLENLKFQSLQRSMETLPDAIMASTVTTIHPSVNKRCVREDACSMTPHASDAPSLKKAKTTDTPHSPSSPFAEILLYEGLTQVKESLKEESVMVDDFVSAVNTGRQFQREERYEDAILSFRKALLCKNKSLSKESPSVQVTFASTLFQVGMIHSYSQYHDPLKAFQTFELCLQMSRACLGENHPSVARVLYEIGVVAEILGEPEKALAHLSEAKAILLSNSVDNHYLKALRMRMSRIQALLGQTEDAESSFNEAEKH
jgi:tetratricopeptide (TPR) repeat protein